MLPWKNNLYYDFGFAINLAEVVMIDGSREEVFQKDSIHEDIGSHSE